jgi:hypothetical protein
MSSICLEISSSEALNRFWPKSDMRWLVGSLAMKSILPPAAP